MSCIVDLNYLVVGNIVLIGPKYSEYEYLAVSTQKFHFILLGPSFLSKKIRQQQIYGFNPVFYLRLKKKCV